MTFEEIKTKLIESRPALVIPFEFFVQEYEKCETEGYPEEYREAVIAAFLELVVNIRDKIKIHEWITEATELQ